MWFVKDRESKIGSFDEADELIPILALYEINQLNSRQAAIERDLNKLPSTSQPSEAFGIIKPGEGRATQAGHTDPRLPTGDVDGQLLTFFLHRCQVE